MIVSIRRRRIFAGLRDRGHRVKHGAVRLTYLDLAAAEAESRPQVAYALGRKFGTAVERNRARRRLRDAFTQTWNDHQQTVQPGLQLRGAFLLSGHRGLLTAPYTGLVTDLTRCFADLMDGVGPNQAKRGDSR